MSVRFEFCKFSKVVLLRGDGVVNYRKNHTTAGLSRENDGDPTQNYIPRQSFSSSVQKCNIFESYHRFREIITSRFHVEWVVKCDFTARPRLWQNETMLERRTTFVVLSNRNDSRAIRVSVIDNVRSKNLANFRFSM